MAPNTTVAEVASVDAPPETRLAHEPEVASIEEVAVALQELSWIGSRQSTEKAKLEQAIRLLKADAEKRQQIKVGRHNTTLGERAQVLEQAVAAFVEANKQIITETGKKTRKFTHGQISLRSTKLSIEPLDETTFDDVLEAVRNLNLRRFYETKYSLDKSRIIEEVAAGKFSEGDLTKIGCRRVDPTDQVKIKPSEYSLEEPMAL